MINHIALGSTGLQVSRIGLGTVKFGRNQAVKYPRAFTLPSDKEIIELLALSKDLGINLLDTAPAYGVSEERLGKALHGQRQHWILSTKAGEEFMNGQSVFDFTADTIIQSIERSLKRLHTDYLDIVLIHSSGEDQKIIEDHAVFDTLARLKTAGKIRAFGMSTKTLSGGLSTIDHADVVMATYNPLQIEEQPILAHAHKKNKGVLIKKAFASGHLTTGNNTVTDALHFIFKEPGVSSIILGTINPQHLRHNIAAAESALGINP